jgi:hypothetical protein
MGEDIDLLREITFDCPVCGEAESCCECHADFRSGCRADEIARPEEETA